MGKYASRHLRHITQQSKSSYTVVLLHVGNDTFFQIFKFSDSSYLNAFCFSHWAENADVVWGNLIHLNSGFRNEICGTSYSGYQGDAVSLLDEVTVYPKDSEQFYFQELKRAFAQGVNFCREQTKINQLLIEGFRAAQWVERFFCIFCAKSW